MEKILKHDDKIVIVNEESFKKTKYGNYYIAKFGIVAKIVFRGNRLNYYKELNTDLSNKGYLRVPLFSKNKKSVHRLLYETYVKEIPDNYVVDHIDANPLNNSLENLRVVTQKENIGFSVTSGKFGSSKKKKIIVYDNLFKEESAYNGVRDFLDYLGLYNYNSLSCLKKYKKYKDRFVIKEV